jgi:hypothetical protein
MQLNLVDSRIIADLVRGSGGGTSVAKLNWRVG